MLQKSTQISCARCVELWREYGRATQAHVALIKEQDRTADAGREHRRDLATLIAEAAKRREAARLAVKSHLALDHGEPSSRAMTAG